MRAFGNLFSAAAAGRGGNTTEAERAAAVVSLTAVYKKIDPDGILDDEKKRKAISDREQCDSYTRFMHELQSLPLKEGAGVIRLMMAS